MAVPAAVAQVIKDLGEMGAYVDARGGNRESCLAVQYEAISARLRNTLEGIPIGVAEAKSICAAVTEGPWAESQRDQLMSVVDSLLLAAVAPTRRSQQICDQPERFPTRSEWRSLRTRGILRQAKIAQLCGRMWTIGITCPQERLAWRLAAIICHVDGVDDEDEQFQVLDDVKASIKDYDEKRKYPLAHVRRYTDPASLPKEIYDFAYGGGEEPANLECPELATVLHIAKRGGRSKNEIKILKPIMGAQQRLPRPRSSPSASASGVQRPSFADLLEDEALQSSPSPSASPAQSPRAMLADSPNAMGATAMVAFKPHAAMSIYAAQGMLAYGRDTTPPAKPSSSPCAARVGDAGEDRAVVESMMGGILGTADNAKPKRRAATKAKTASAKRSAAAKAKNASKRPAAACGSVGVRKRPAAVASSGSRKLVLGCSKCRRSPTGCGKCRSPAFGGKRG